MVWTWSAIWPGSTMGSIRATPVSVRHGMRQKAWAPLTRVRAAAVVLLMVVGSEEVSGDWVSTYRCGLVSLAEQVGTGVGGGQEVECEWLR